MAKRKGFRDEKYVRIHTVIHVTEAEKKLLEAMAPTFKGRSRLSTGLSGAVAELLRLGIARLREYYSEEPDEGHDPISTEEALEAGLTVPPTTLRFPSSDTSPGKPRKI